MNFFSIFLRGSKLAFLPFSVECREWSSLFPLESIWSKACRRDKKRFKVNSDLPYSPVTTTTSSTTLHRESDLYVGRRYRQTCNILSAKRSFNLICSASPTFYPTGPFTTLQLKNKEIGEFCEMVGLVYLHSWHRVQMVEEQFCATSQSSLFPHLAVAWPNISLQCNSLKTRRSTIFV